MYGPQHGPQHGQPHNSGMGELSRKVIGDTNFVTAWVILAFLSFELCVYVFSIDLVSAFEGYRLLIPMIAVLIGFIPGCGPQVLVTSLYLTGVVPLSVAPIERCGAGVVGGGRWTTGPCSGGLASAHLC